MFQVQKLTQPLCFGLLLFAEYRDVHVVRLLGGRILLLAGALLVAGA